MNRKYKGDNNVSVYFSFDAEIEKLQLIIEHQKSLLEQKDKQIEQLQKINALLEEKP